MSPEPGAITFDFWNTLVVAPKGRLAARRREVVAEALRDHDAALEDDVLTAHLDAATALYEQAWRSGAPFEPVDAANSLVAAIGSLGIEGKRSVAAAYLQAGESAQLELAPNAGETIRGLRAAGVSLGIVCDVGLTGSPFLRGFLARQKLLECFDGWAFSDEVGCFKPSPLIFRHVIDQLEIPPGAEIWHVGDLRRTDVAGARVAGLVPVRYRGLSDDRSGEPDADHVIDDLAELIYRFPLLARGARIVD